MKRKPTKLTLDDLAFEGRNQDYGAYVLRKTYHARLVRSFLCSICFLLLVLLVFSRIIHRRDGDYVYNPVTNAMEVGVNLAHTAPTLVSIQHIEGLASQQAVVADRIEEDDVAEKENESKPEKGSSDSTNTTGSGQSTKGQANPNVSSTGVEGEVYGSADINPQFPGGNKAMQEFIKANLQYPDISRRANIVGSIMIYVVVAYDGSLKDVKVIKGLQAELDEEAIRVVKMMPLWKPALRGGKAVNVRCIVPISVTPMK